MNRKIITLLTAPFWMMNASAQMLSPSVLATSGGYSAGSNASLSWTLGETIITTVQAGDNMLTQGFQQPENLTGPLPVSIIDFHAIRADGKSVLIQWHTASESNNEGFDIERRLEHESGFTKKGFVASQATDGNSFLELAYTYKDPNNFAGISYYRLKQWDYDRHSTYTIIKAVSGASNAAVSLVVFPNPNNGQFKIILEGISNPVAALITDINGRMIRKLNITNDEPAQVTNLLPGVYIVSIPDVFGIGRSFSEKVIVGK